MSVIGVEPRKIDVWIVSEWKLRHDFYRSGQAHALLGKSPKVGKHLKSDRICPHWWCRWISHHTPDYDSAFKTPAGNLAYIRIWERVYGSLPHHLSTGRHKIYIKEGSQFRSFGCVYGVLLLLPRRSRHRLRLKAVRRWFHTLIQKHYLEVLHGVH